MIDFIGAWADEEFGPRNIDGVILKMLEEINEFRSSNYSSDELADMAILLFDLAYQLNIDLEEVVHEKMKINVARVWEKLDNGTFKHRN